MNLSFTLGQIANATKGKILGGNDLVPVPRISIDTRSLKPGDCFVAFKGERVDGHRYLVEAVSKGCASVIVSEDVPSLGRTVGVLKVNDSLEALQAIGRAHREQFKIPLVALTGSNGKTTTKEMLAQVFKTMEIPVLATRGNYNSQIGLPLMLMEIEPHHRFAVLEMGASSQGDIKRLARLASPQVGVVTNIGKAHLEFFGDLEGVLKAKWELVEGLSPEGTAVVNGDDPFLAKNLKTWKGRNLITFGLSKEASVRAENIQDGERVSFDLVSGEASAGVSLSVPGVFNVSNALAAAAAALACGLRVEDIARGLGAFSPPSHRSQLRQGLRGSQLMLDSYNANPTSMEASLRSFVEAFSGHQKVVVLGGMKELGKGSRQYHEELGALLAELPLENIFLVGEEASWIAEGYGKKGSAQVRVMDSKESAVRELEKILSPQTAILFKGSRSARLEDVFTPLLLGDQ